MPDIGMTFRKPFAEQVAAYRLRLGNLIPTQSWLDVQGNAHDRGFMVAGAAKADLLADLASAVGKAIETGTTLEEFRKDFREIVARNGWTGWTGEGSAKGEAWRTRTIYRTNLATSYAAGRHAQLLRYPIWIYIHSGSEHPRLHHLALHGIALPSDHIFWKTHFAPNGWGCGCEVRGARTTAGIRRAGGDPLKQLPEGWNVRDAKGQLPAVQKGWDHAPGATVTDLVNALKDKLPKMPAAIGARMAASWPARTTDDIAREFAGFVDRSLSSRVEQNYMIIGALQPSWVDAAARHGLAVESAEIAVTDRNIQHTFRGTSHVTVGSTKRPVGQKPKAAPLDLNWFKLIPRFLRAPRAVLLDPTKQETTFLLVFDVPGNKAKLVIEVNTPVKKAGAIMNTLQSGRLVSPSDLKGDVARGVLLIEGSL